MPTPEWYDSIQIAYIKGQIALLPLYLIFFAVPGKMTRLENRMAFRNALVVSSILLTAVLQIVPWALQSMTGYVFPAVVINASVNAVLEHPAKFRVYQFVSVITAISALVFALLFIQQFAKERIISNAAEHVKRIGRLKIIFSSRVMSPFSTGLLFVKIYFPYRFLADKTSLLPILAHEAAHIRRRHLLMDFIDKFYVALGWYNPLSYFLLKKGVELREFECDRIVTRQYPATEYGKILIKEAEAISRAGKWALSSAFITHSLFKRRLLMLFERGAAGTRRVAALLAAAAVLCSGFLFLAFSASAQTESRMETGYVIKPSADETAVPSFGGRSHESIFNTVMGNVGDLRKVYNDFLKTNPGLKGKVTLEFSIEPSGKVSKMNTKASTTGNRRFDDAIGKKVATWDFGKKDKAGTATITYPFAFSE